MQADGRQMGFGLPLVILSSVIWCLLVAEITGLEMCFCESRIHTNQSYITYAAPS